MARVPLYSAKSGQAASRIVSASGAPETREVASDLPTQPSAVLLTAENNFTIPTYRFVHPLPASNRLTTTSNMAPNRRRRKNEIAAQKIFGKARRHSSSGIASNETVNPSPSLASRVGPAPRKSGGARSLNSRAGPIGITKVQT
ncbi:BgtAc-30426 [Blumeria graminis f. sp. tritici]|uniref:BgtAc-30426 n=2 Tax=Blumeria graminis f. sp. tritici TaxID=62690 RepID=A0A9X9QC61_BLUGR|nr:hypothetical protein BGT96224_Ac30426 [Blumeria graminis f. sp. tritici 96224]VDB85761.1 BgtAc-30426 [Blumeria graminis f. sp. tritici]